jgi:hypothetical protein
MTDTGETALLDVRELETDAPPGVADPLPPAP